MKAALILFSLLGVICICNAQANYTYIQPYNFQEKRIRHQDFRGKIIELANDADDRDGRFRIVPGLADPKMISFESVNNPGYYFRHRNLEVWLDKFDGTDINRNDATFKIVPGVANKDWISFEPLNFAGFYLRHANFSLFIHKPDGTPTYNSDVTFRLTQSMSNQVATFIQPWNCPLHRLRYQPSDGRAKIDILANGDDKQQASWKLVPGLSDPTFISFESVNRPGNYLRAKGTGEELWLDKDDGSAQFKKDATFKIVNGLVEEDAISFECASRPGWFIQHWGFVVWVRKNEGEVFPVVATFRKTSLMNEPDGAVAFLADI